MFFTRFLTRCVTISFHLHNIKNSNKYQKWSKTNARPSSHVNWEIPHCIPITVCFTKLTIIQSPTVTLFREQCFRHLNTKPINQIVWFPSLTRIQKYSGTSNSERCKLQKSALPLPKSPKVTSEKYANICQGSNGVFRRGSSFFNFLNDCRYQLKSKISNMQKLFPSPPKEPYRIPQRVYWESSKGIKTTEPQ